jgi:hypothetical protein
MGWLPEAAFDALGDDPFDELSSMPPLYHKVVMVFALGAAGFPVTADAFCYHNESADC